MNSNQVSKSHYGHDNFADFVSKIKPYSSQPDAWDKLKADIFQHFDKNGNPIADEAFLEEMLKFRERGTNPGTLFAIKNGQDKFAQGSLMERELQLLSKTLNSANMPVELRNIVDHRKRYDNAALSYLEGCRVSLFSLIPLVPLIQNAGLVALIGYFLSWKAGLVLLAGYYISWKVALIALVVNLITLKGIFMVLVGYFIAHAIH